jgi:hypothetical protein
MGNLLDRKTLLTRETLKVVKVEFENGDFVFVKQMTGRDRDLFEQSLVVKTKDKKGTVSFEQNLEDFRAKLAVITICDENGNNLLQPGDFPLLSQSMSAAHLETIINKAQEINKISEADKEDLLKNSEVGQSDNSISDSAEN